MNPADGPPPDTPPLNPLRTGLRRYLTERSPPGEVRRLMETPEGYDRAVWLELTERFGVLRLLMPPEYGGTGGGWPEMAAVIEETGRVLLCAPLLSTGVLATAAILSADDDDAQRRLLPAIGSGGLLATVAGTEDDGAWDPDAMTTVATGSGATGSETARSGPVGYRLHGHKAFVVDGAIAEVIIVAARAPAGISLFLMEGDAAGLRRTPVPTMDQTRKLARLEFSATPAYLLGREGAGREVLRRVQDLASVALAAEQVGGARRCLEMAVDHARRRHQFGRAIGSFQAVKHKCADMLVAVESARSAAEHAARVAGSGTGERPDLTVAASLAKAYCSDAYSRVAADNLQIRGATGFSWDDDAHLYLKRATSSTLLFGDPSYHRRRLAGPLALGET